MAAPFYTTPICTARLEDLDADLGSFAAALALITAAGPVTGRTAWKQLAAVRQQVETTAARTATEVARLRGTPLPDWPARRPHFVAIAATLGSAGQWLFDLGAAEAAGGNAELALGWFGQRAGQLGEEVTAAIEEVDAALAEMLRQAMADAAAACEAVGYPAAKEGA